MKPPRVIYSAGVFANRWNTIALCVILDLLKVQTTQGVSVPKLIDLTGQQVGRWEVTGRAENRGSQTMWECRCSCGTVRSVWAGDLASGRSRSCGCKTPEMRRQISQRRTRHGHARPVAGRASREYESWSSAKSRCHNPNDKDFPSYGGRGVAMCERWREDFAAFLNDMGECPPARTLDRIDGDGNYEPGNCRWATYTQQNRNRAFATDMACRKGHPRTRKNTYISPAGNRYCRVCRDEWRRNAT